MARPVESLFQQASAVYTLEAVSAQPLLAYGHLRGGLSIQPANGQGTTAAYLGNPLHRRMADEIAPVAPPAAAQPDDDRPVTRGELRDEIRAVNARLDSIDRTLLEMRSERTGVQLVGPVIPAATTVVENNSFFAHVSQAVLRHKGRYAVKKIVSRFRCAKKYM